jgi:hypothetical protein
VSCGLGVGFVNEATRWRCPDGVALLDVTDLNLPWLSVLVWMRQNTSPLLARFVTDVRMLAKFETNSKGRGLRSIR